MGKIKKDPEQETRWAEERRQMAERVEFLEDKIRRERERADRRRELLRRFSFGLLGGRSG